MVSETRSMLQRGDGSEFDKSLAALERMHYCIVLAANHSYNDDWDSLRGWHRALQMFDRELHASYNPEDKERLNKVRIRQILMKENTRNNVRRKLDAYERVLREIHTEKGFNIKAKANASNAALEAARARG